MCGLGHIDEVMGVGSLTETCRCKGSKPRWSLVESFRRFNKFRLLSGPGNLEREIMHPGYIVPHLERAHKEPVSLFRVCRYVAEVNLCGSGVLRRDSGAFITAGCLLGRLYLGCKSRALILSPEQALGVSLDCYKTVGSWHFDLEISIMWDYIEAREGCAP